jgi:pyoverdine/dityrosine biosynthesis protein Dit1
MKDFSSVSEACLKFTTEDSEPFEPQGYSLLESESVYTRARLILGTIMEFRRSPDAHLSCDVSCRSCHSPHIAKIITAIKTNERITLVLPAFPGKSPNLSKVLSPLPDLAEQLALEFLEQLCGRIRDVYTPGAQIILCSDGRVFSDIVGMRETDVTEYQRGLTQLIAKLGLKNISTFNLDESFGGKNFHQMRQELMEQFGVPQEVLRKKILRGSKGQGGLDDVEAHRMYCGITRFLVEDSTFPGQTKSRSAIQKEGKTKAYEVIRRSNAWSELIAQRFPRAIRLSIHPQTCGSKKLGIRLIGAESWMTPWHGVAVKTDKGFILLKRTEAEALGARLIFSVTGRPSHFELPSNKSFLVKLKEAEVLA